MKDIKSILAKERRRARSGDAEAMHTLATLYYNMALRPLAMKRGFKLAIKWAEKALKQGSAWSATLLGHVYSNPKFDGRSLPIALKYYKRAADLGHQYAAELVANLSKTDNSERVGRAERRSL